ncbi:hypothetical protein PFMC_02127 [Plasmodium falciparum CAMP/Malaysia]|uniref:Small nuclear ribonucleoprotein G n=1 Tax=Plasmodium falciparum (isolate Camp / Malaysia) TaxID=5835 RepID=A0A024X910_PLAFC|nr:hypothetical protein PFMC_02127 [Plasmodium falciparum CAMP/Malaysia]
MNKTIHQFYISLIRKIKDIIYLNGNRQVVGILRGYDTFMNLVLDNTMEIKKDEQIDIGVVVIRGNSISYWECLDKVNIK